MTAESVKLFRVQSKNDHGPRAIIVMGVSGAGKTVVGQALARAIGWTFSDADEFHSPENKAKMHRGIGLTDADRAPWLAALRAHLERELAEGRRIVLACSALKQAYRDALMIADETRFVYLSVPKSVLHERLMERHHAFATPALLDSQLETLEEPADALRVDGTLSIPEIVAFIRRNIGV